MTCSSTGAAVLGDAAAWHPIRTAVTHVTSEAHMDSEDRTGALWDDPLEQGASGASAVQARNRRASDHVTERRGDTGPAGADLDSDAGHDLPAIVPEGERSER